MPRQHSAWGHRKDLGPPATRNQAGKRREPEPVLRLVANLLHVAPQHSVLVPQHQYFRILGHIALRDGGQRAEQLAGEPVRERDQHPSMISTVGGPPTTGSGTNHIHIFEPHRAMRSTSRVIRGCLRGRPGRLCLDFATHRRFTRSRCQRRIVAGVTGKCRAPWRRRGITASSVAIRARSAQDSLGRAVPCRCRTVSWWRSSRISASFHAEGRRESRNHAGIRRARRYTKRRHTVGDHGGDPKQSATSIGG